MISLIRINLICFCKNSSAGGRLTAVDTGAFDVILFERKTTDGRRQILEFGMPGSILGFVPTIDSTLTHNAESLISSTIAVIPRKRLSYLCVSDPDLSLHLLSMSAESLNQAFEKITDMGRRTAREALAHLFFRLYTRIQARYVHGDQTSVMVPITQEHIGDACGLTTAHVCRTLRELREDEILYFRYGVLDVLDIDRLREVSGVFRTS